MRSHGTAPTATCHAHIRDIRFVSGFSRAPHNLLTESERGRMCDPVGELTMSDGPSPPAPERKPLTPEAQRALAEAEARRQAAHAPLPRELQGPKGPEPTRYGDWENKGIASDF
jgi:hypothetical protein